MSALEDEAKDYVVDLLKCYPDYSLLPIIERAMSEGDREHGGPYGFVVWDANPPANVAYHTHKFSFIDAVEAACAFMRTDCFNEWVVCPPIALSIVRTLPQFVEEPQPSGGQLNYVGRLGTKKVYAYPRYHQDVGAGTPISRFWVGIRNKCVLCLIQNSPINLIGPE